MTVSLEIVRNITIGVFLYWLVSFSQEKKMFGKLLENCLLCCEKNNALEGKHYGMLRLSLISTFFLFY